MLESAPTFEKFKLESNLHLAYDSFGERSSEKPAVILSHGGGQTRYAWKNTGERLAEQGYYSIAYDHRGHGDSSWSPDGEYGVKIFAQDQLALAQSFAQKPILVGASLGGLASMLVEGYLAPNTYKAIVLVDVTPTLNRSGTDKIFEFMSANMQEGFASLDEAADTIAKYTGRKRQKDSSGLAKNLRQREGRWFWHWDPAFIDIRQRDPSGPERMRNAAKSLSCPVFLVRGKQSDIVELEQVEEFLQLVPHAKFVDVDQARHMVAGDKNDIFTAQLLNFIASL